MVERISFPFHEPLSLSQVESKIPSYRPLVNGIQIGSLSAVLGTSVSSASVSHRFSNLSAMLLTYIKKALVLGQTLGASRCIAILPIDSH